MRFFCSCLSGFFFLNLSAENKSTSTHEQRIEQREKMSSKTKKNFCFFFQVNFGQCLAGFWLGVRIEVFQRLRKEKDDFLRQRYRGSGVIFLLDYPEGVPEDKSDR